MVDVNVYLFFMALRPVYISPTSANSLLEKKEVKFKWYSGLSVSQKQKSIESFHNAAKKDLNLKSILEISSKSKNRLGVNLSAFNLKLNSKNNIKASVEAFFQGSKTFKHGGPYVDLYEKTAREAKLDQRLLVSGNLVEFSFDNHKWPLSPPTVFYDWLYCSALLQNNELAKELIHYQAFTDIEFNPKKSINCQAASAAIFKSLVKQNLISKAMKSYSNFIKIHQENIATNTLIQTQLF